MLTVTVAAITPEAGVSIQIRMLRGTAPLLRTRKNGRGLAARLPIMCRGRAGVSATDQAS